MPYFKPLLTILILLGTLACRPATADSRASKPLLPPTDRFSIQCLPSGVRREAVERQVVPAVVLTGVVEASPRTPLSAPVEGIFTPTGLKEGMTFQSGQELGRIANVDRERGDLEIQAADRALVARESAAQTDLDQAELSRKQAADLFESGIVSRSFLADREFAVDRAKARIRELHAEHEGLMARAAASRRNLEGLVVRAPFAGRVLTINTRGGFVSQGTSIAELVAERDLKIVVRCDPAAAAALRSRQIVEANHNGQICQLRPAAPDTDRNPTDPWQLSFFLPGNHTLSVGATLTISVDPEHVTFRIPRLAVQPHPVRTDELGFWCLVQNQVEWVPLLNPGDGPTCTIPAHFSESTVLIGVPGRITCQEP